MCSYTQNQAKDHRGCGRCLHRNPAGAQFCAMCGRPLRDAGPSPQAPAAPQPVAPLDSFLIPPGTPGRTLDACGQLLSWVLVLSGVFVLIAALTGLLSRVATLPPL